MFAHLYNTHPFSWINQKGICKEMTKNIQLFLSKRFVSFLDDLRIEFPQKIIPLCAFCFNIVENVEAFKRIISKKHVKENDSYWPEIYTFIVRFVCENLRGHEVWCTTMRFGCLTQLFGKAKISYFTDVRVLLFWDLFQEYVFTLEVSVYDILLVDGFESPQDLNEDGAGFLQFEDLVWHTILIWVKISILTVFHD